MAHTAGGRYPVSGPGGVRNPAQQAQFNAAYAAHAQGGQYYHGFQQPFQQTAHYQQHPYYAQNAQSNSQPQSLGMNYARQQAPPPPPPPPPGEAAASTSASTTAPVSTSSFTSNPSSLVNRTGRQSTLVPPPLPPMFPWMSQALADSMNTQSSLYGKSFKDEASNLPFVPIIVNDADLAKMTENVIKEAEEIKGHQLQYYKEVLSQDLPPALKDMFQPLYCKLCAITLSSPVVAKDHYRGKRHKKAVETWLMKNPHLAMKKSIPNTNSIKPPQAGNSSGGAINGYIIKKSRPPPGLQSGAGAAPSLPPASLVNRNPQPLVSSPVDRKRPAPPDNSIQHDLPNEQSSQGQPQNMSCSSKPAFNSSTFGNGTDGESGGVLRQSPMAKPNADVGNGSEFWAKRQRNDNIPAGAKGMCEICSVQLTSQIQADQHYKGKVHAAKIAALQGQAGGVPAPSVGLVAPAGGVVPPTTELPGSSLTQRLQTLAAASGGPALNNTPRQPQPPQNTPQPLFPSRGGGGFRPRGGSSRGGGPPRFNNMNPSQHIRFNQNRGGGGGPRFRN